MHSTFLSHMPTLDPSKLYFFYGILCKTIIFFMYMLNATKNRTNKLFHVFWFIILFIVNFIFTSLHPFLFIHCLLSIINSFSRINIVNSSLIFLNTAYFFQPLWKYLSLTVLFVLHLLRVRIKIVIN